MVTVTDTAHNIPGVLNVYCFAFEGLIVDQVTWIAYPPPQHDAPFTQRSVWGMSLHNYYIIYHHNVTYHPANCVLRQFGYCQPIPYELLVYIRNRAKFSLRVSTLIEGWNTRFDRHGVQQMGHVITQTADFLGFHEYIMWWGAPRLMHPGYQFQEPHYTPVGFDDAGLRNMSRRIHQVLPTFEHAILNKNIDCRRVVQESVNVLHVPIMSPIPSIIIQVFHFPL